MAIKRKVSAEKSDMCCSPMMHGKSNGCLYGLGFIGAAVYYIQHAATFWFGALGILKALVWPAFIVYKLLVFLK